MGMDTCTDTDTNMDKNIDIISNTSNDMDHEH